MPMKMFFNFHPQFLFLYCLKIYQSSSLYIKSIQEIILFVFDHLFLNLFYFDLLINHSYIN